MPSYNLSLVGLELSFKTDAEADRVENALELVEERYNGLVPSGRNLSKEKLLSFVALGLADDLLESKQELDELREKLDRLLMKINSTDE
ncbi:cell division protein ZapA [Desulfovibrio inopinatus]|uniref:cell division protein ZapA n=1 Tax=Desulfovibrio inopinatus TaxID=102109 RepID=UPI0004811CA3|nr:cell division protein ZapA [Desulfovibrio inopinatus]